MELSWDCSSCVSMLFVGDLDFVCSLGLSFLVFEERFWVVSCVAKSGDKGIKIPTASTAMHAI